MKKKLVAIAVVVMVFLSSGAFAMEFMLGAKAGYYAWQPFYSEIDASGFSDIGWGDGVLYGPIVSFIFTPEISLSVAGLLGKQSTHWQSVFSDLSGSTNEITGNYSFDVFRADIDSVLSYRLGGNFRLFAGYKYLYMNASFESTEIRTDAVAALDEIIVSSSEGINHLHGPAAGIGYSYPVSGHFFTSITLSGVYLLGSMSNGDSTQYKSSGGGALIQSNDSGIPDSDMRQIGLNIEPAIGMSAGEGLPIITLGVRYQRFWVEFLDNHDVFGDKWLGDTMIGVFVSVVYMF